MKPAERNFVNLMVYQGLSRIEAYCEATGTPYEEENKRSIEGKAARMFYRPQVNSYYYGVMQDINAKQTKKGAWTKEVATDKLMRLIERAEEDIYGNPTKGVDPKQLTMSRLNAIILPAKELNLMHGFNQTNVSMEGCVVQICGEDELID